MSYEISSTEWEARKAFVKFEDKDIQAIATIAPMAEFFAGEVVEWLYLHLFAHERSRQHLPLENIEGLKRMQGDYFLQLFSGVYDDGYLQSRIQVGVRHHQVGLPLDLFIETYSQYYLLIRPHVFEYLDDEDEAFRALDAISKLITLDQSVAVDAFVAMMLADKG